MATFFRPIKAVLKGQNTSYYIKFAQNQLSILERLMSYQNINEGTRIVSPCVGVTVKCISRFGSHEIHIDTSVLDVTKNKNILLNKQLQLSKRIKIKKKNATIFCKATGMLDEYGSIIAGYTIKSLEVSLDTGMVTLDDWEIDPITADIDSWGSIVQLRKKVVTTNGVKYVPMLEYSQEESFSDTPMPKGFEILEELDSVPKLDFQFGAVSINTTTLNLYTANFVDTSNVASAIIEIKKYGIISDEDSNTPVWSLVIDSTINPNSILSATLIHTPELVVSNTGIVGRMDSVRIRPLVGEPDWDGTFRNNDEVSTFSGVNYDRHVEMNEVQILASYNYNINTDSFNLQNFKVWHMLPKYDPIMPAVDFVSFQTTESDMRITSDTSKIGYWIDSPLNAFADVNIYTVPASQSFRTGLHVLSSYSIGFMNGPIIRNYPNSTNVAESITDSSQHQEYKTYMGSAFIVSNGSLVYRRYIGGALPIAIANYYQHHVGQYQSWHNLGWYGDNWGGSANYNTGHLQGQIYPTRNVITDPLVGGIDRFFSLLATPENGNWWDYVGVETTFPDQIVVEYPFYIPAVSTVEKSFSVYDQETNVLFNGIKYTSSPTLRPPFEGPGAIKTYWRIEVSTPYVQNVDITQQISDAFGEDLFMEKFCMMYFHTIDEIKTVVPEV